MTKKAMMAVALCINGFFSYAYLQLTVPLISVMSADLGFTNPTLINLISTITSLMIIPTVLVCGKLSQRVSKKEIFLVGCVIFAVGGSATAFANSIWTVLICRAVVGVGAGIGVLLVTAFIPDYYEGKALSNMMGIVCSVGALLGVLEALLAGFIGDISWRWAFLLHLSALIPMALTLFFVPDKPTVSVAQTEPEHGKIQPLTYLYAFLGLLIWMSLMTLYSNVSIFISNESLGTTSQAGVATSVITGAGAVAGLVFGKVFQVLKKFTVHLYMLLAVAAFALFAYANSYGMAVVGAAFIGLTVGFLAPTLLNSAVIASPDCQTRAQSVVLCGIYIGQFVSTFWSSAVNPLAGGTLRGEYRVNMLFNIAVLVIAIIVAVVGRQRKKSKEVVK